MKQKDDVFSCEMALCVGQDSGIFPLTEHEPPLESKNGDSSSLGAAHPLSVDVLSCDRSRYFMLTV